MGRLSRALAAAAPSKVFLAGVGSVSDPAPGQMWRAWRANKSMLVFISAVAATEVDAAPVTVNEFSDSDAADLPPSASKLAAPLTVWLGMTRTLPMRSLGEYVADLTTGADRTQMDGRLDVLDAVRTAGTPGPAPASPADPQVVFRARLNDTLAILASVPDLGGTGELQTILKEAGLDTTELTELLGVKPATVLALRRGRAAVSPDQATALSARVGLSAADLLAANPAPPAALVAYLSRPAARAKVTALAMKRNVDEDVAFSDAAYATYALAARASGDTKSDSAWAALADRYFQSVLE